MQVPLSKKEILLSSSIWNYFYLFLLSLYLSKSTAFTLFWFSVHFLSWCIASLSGQLSLHLGTPQLLIFADLSWIFQSYLQVQHPYFTSYINWDEVPQLGMRFVSALSSPQLSPSSFLTLLPLRSYAPFLLSLNKGGAPDAPNMRQRYWYSHKRVLLWRYV